MRYDLGRKRLPSTVTLAITLTTLSLLILGASAWAQQAPTTTQAARGGRGGGGGAGGGGLTADAIAQAAQAKPDIPPGPFQPTWESLRANWKPPEWF